MIHSSQPAVVDGMRTSRTAIFFDPIEEDSSRTLRSVIAWE